MALVKKSFLSNMVGNTYDEFKGYAKPIIAIGTCILAIIYPLSDFFHWGVISGLLNLFTGTSILFIIYVAAIVITLDIEVEEDEPESNYWSEPGNKPMSTAYKLTIVWGVVLIALGISAVYFSNKYRKHYAFECNTFLVDTYTRIYHLNYNNDCEYAATARDLEKMKGYQIDESYEFCDWCAEWLEDAESSAEADAYSSR